MWKLTYIKKKEGGLQTQGSGGREEEKRKCPASQPPPLLSASSEREEGSEEEEESIGYAAKSWVKINYGWLTVVNALLLHITYMDYIHGVGGVG